LLKASVPIPGFAPPYWAFFDLHIRSAFFTTALTVKIADADRQWGRFLPFTEGKNQPRADIESANLKEPRTYAVSHLNSGTLELFPVYRSMWIGTSARLARTRRLPPKPDGQTSRNQSEVVFAHEIP
jgi:hypothetical protein